MTDVLWSGSIASDRVDGLDYQLVLAIGSSPAVSGDTVAANEGSIAANRNANGSDEQILLIVP